MVQILVQRAARRETIQIQITMGSFPTERKIRNLVPTSCRNLHRNQPLLSRNNIEFLECCCQQTTPYPSCPLRQGILVFLHHMVHFWVFIQNLQYEAVTLQPAQNKRLAQIYPYIYRRAPNP